MTGNVTSALQGLSARAALEGIEVIASASDNLTAAEEAARRSGCHQSGVLDVDGFVDIHCGYLDILDIDGYLRHFEAFNIA